MEKVDVAIVGGGQSGLSVAKSLSNAGIENVVLERGRVAQAWRDRWDSFCLVTPNWAIALTDRGYEGTDPDGFMPRDDIVDLIQGYARMMNIYVREGVEATAIDADADGFLVDTSSGTLRSRAVVLCNGAFQRPFRPKGHESLPTDIFQIDSTAYRKPEDLPAGDVLIIGSGQTGCQLAEELHEAGRQVVLSCGKAPWIPRRLGDKDIVWWAVETGFLEQPVSALPHPSARLGANLLNTGHDGGHDLHYRTLQQKGIMLTGRFLGADGYEAIFADDLAQSVAWGDDRYREFTSLIKDLVRARGITGVTIEEPPPFVADAPQRLSLFGFGAVIFTGGFRPDYGGLVTWPMALDEYGFPVQVDGASVIKEGLFFAGVHFLRKRKSSILLGTGEDAAVVAGKVGEYLRV